jgi:MSHA biogenesis protein MshP
VTAIFLLVILAGLGAAMVSFFSTQQQSTAMDVQGGRGYQAARAGIEWGAYQVLKGANACPASPATITFTGTPLEGFTTSVTCSVTVDSEGGNTVSVYVFQSTATYGAAGSVDHIERQLSAQIARCVDAGGNAC